MLKALLEEGITETLPSWGSPKSQGGWEILKSGREETGNHKLCLATAFVGGTRQATPFIDSQFPHLSDGDNSQGCRENVRVINAELLGKHPIPTHRKATRPVLWTASPCEGQGSLNH